MQWASPAQLLAHFWGQAISTPNPDADIRSLEEAGAFYIAEDGTPVQLKAEEALNAMIAAKVWGFTEDPEHSAAATIHYFRTSDATAERLFLFAVHEGSHAVIEPLIETFGPALDGELLAEVVSAVAARARRFAYGPVGNPAKEG